MCVAGGPARRRADRGPRRSAAGWRADPRSIRRRAARPTRAADALLRQVLLVPQQRLADILVVLDVRAAARRVGGEVVHDAVPEVARSTSKEGKQCNAEAPKICVIVDGVTDVFLVVRMIFNDFHEVFNDFHSPIRVYLCRGPSGC